MTKVIHSDFLTVAEAMTSAFSTIEIIKLGIYAFFGSLVGTLFSHAPEGTESTLHRAGI